jgi:hypothetical protein
MPVRHLPVLALLLAAAPFGATASAGCDDAAKVPSVWVPGGYGSAGPYVEACGFRCAPVAATPELSVPGVVDVGSGHVNNCT